MTSFSDQLIPLVGPFNGEQLFELQALVFPAGLLLWLAPGWKHTHTICLFPILLHTTVYTIAMITYLINNPPEGNFDSLESIWKLFADPNLVYIGWAHFLSHDLIVARMMSIDALQFTTSYLEYALIMGPCLFLVIMLSPIGVTLYALVRLIVFRNRSPKKEKES